MRGHRSLPTARSVPAAEAGAALRIIGGDLRGRRLGYVPSARTRPMKDRVREVLFDLIGTDIRGAVALDLFAGTGALGFEALSRGAARALFVERHFPTADAIRRSARDLDVVHRAEIRSGDVLLWGRRLPELPAEGPWFIFLSPPWDFFHSRWESLETLIRAVAGAAPADSRFFVEAVEAFDPQLLPDPLTPAGQESPWETRAIPPAVLHSKRL
jgi:16S rRNA (guanine966-N2)-methyltransferase